MNVTLLGLHAAFVVTSLIWVRWRRKHSRLSRVLGVVVLFGVLLLLPWTIQRLR